MSEKRREPRHRTFLKGRIVFNNGTSSMDCLVRDMSTSGARIAIAESLVLPDAFELEIPQKDSSFNAVLRWRREDGMGVQLKDSPQPDDTQMDDLLKRIGELEAENRMLRRRLAAKQTEAASSE